MKPKKQWRISDEDSLYILYTLLRLSGKTKEDIYTNLKPRSKTLFNKMKKLGRI